MNKLQLYIPFLALTFDSLFSIDIFDNEFDVVYIDKDIFLKKCRDKSIEYHVESNFEDNKVWVVTAECKCQCDKWNYCFCEDDCQSHKEFSMSDDFEWVIFEKNDYELLVKEVPNRIAE